jgi:hypothetical protein
MQTTLPRMQCSTRVLRQVIQLSSTWLVLHAVPDAAFTVNSARASWNLSASASLMRAWNSALSDTTCRQHVW